MLGCFWPEFLGKTGFFGNIVNGDTLFLGDTGLVGNLGKFGDEGFFVVMFGEIGFFCEDALIFTVGFFDTRQVWICWSILSWV